ncbi:MAG TPA: LysR family transcriptional regulator [Steroidobacteraceae bacterium]|nr:LysR family transcriptional regulator [Steroidobacteraceae bacterium]
MIDIDWSDFKLLLALSRGGSVAGAGRLMGIDSSTVSRRLAQIEQTLGACLVVRGGREFTFTPEGKVAVAAAESMEVIVSNASTAIRASKTEIDGVVRISTVPSMLRTLMPLMAVAADRYPKLSIEINADTRTIDLAKGEADIALRMIQPRELNLIANRGFEMGFGVFASQAYLAKHGLPQTPEDLHKHRLIQYIEPMLHLPWFGWLEAYANKGAPATRVDGTEMAASLVCAGNGIGVLPHFTGNTSPELVRVFPEPVACAIGWVVYHETARNSARIRAVVALLSEFLAGLKEELSGRKQ